jgi:rubrerythrin
MKPAAPATLEELMAQALALEQDAQQRYAELADAMEMHNNRDVAELFRRMSVIEGRHAEQIMAEMGWEHAPPGAAAPPWEGFESAEAVAIDDVHYLMRPWHALQLALAAEQRAERFFAALAIHAATEPVRNAALQMQQEEREHIELLRQWIARVPQPEKDWAVDPDPPRYDH